MSTTRPPTFIYHFNPEENGGEAIMLSSSLVREDPDESFVTQEFSMDSYGNSSSLHMSFYLTPDKLRDCANKLEKFLIANGVN